ncbi:MAG TPA: hypothetical protein PLM53_06830 [Spirochaetota bacterium]|mgnify:CR=1 FL=1|nr:hypothetical protein [Spirochaetota bacterium]HPC40867.1 hypothetical protein [Spirochaetota bacterium]HQF07743.1 hypothetical protein [Spirochaetota bacterium]HQH96796.1 hypothetical protein [Spirochaetota bacterium]HQJ70697.1 hypothetical protein [Spirochaetota bacterium]
MKLTIGQLSHLFEKYGDGTEIKYFDDILIKDSCFLSTDLVLPAHLPRLAENGIGEVEVFFTPVLYEHLTREFPAEFRKPYGRCSMSEMDKMLEDLRDANTQSKRKRYVRIIGEIYGVDKTLGKRIILLRNNEPVDFKKWNNLKRDVDRNHYFQYRNSEVAIIIFVDLKVARQKEYIERFKINTDLISLIVSRSQEPGNVIAPDFIATEDVISVTEPGMLLEEYIRSNARLIIIGEKLDDFYKRALLQVRNYDKFVRLLVVPSLDHTNSHDFFHQVKLVYNNDRWL